MLDKKRIRTTFVISIILLSSFFIVTNINYIIISQNTFQDQLPDANSQLETKIFDFDSQTTIDVGQMPLSIDSGDVNNDGENDIVVANNESNSVSILLWDITMDDWVVQNRSVGSGPCSVAVGDANNDGSDDIVTANCLSNDISVLIWNQTSQNWTSQTLTVGNQPRSVAIGDTTNNGLNEIVVANFNDDNISIFTWNTSSTNWNSQITRGVGNEPFTLEIGDAYQDGLNEIIIGNGSRIIILRWNETLKDWNTPYYLGPLGNPMSALGLGDGNNDGQMELMKTSLFDNSMFFWTWNHDTKIWAMSSTPVGSTSSAIDVGDVNSDGQNDIITVNKANANVSILFWNNSANTWNVSTKSVGTGPTSVLVDDVNNDGLVEIATANSIANTITVLFWNTTRGSLVSGRITRAVGDNPRGVAVGDANNDGESDIVVANSNNKSVSVLIWNATLNNWNPAIELDANISPTSVDINDANNDGFMDIVVCSFSVLGNVTSILIWNKTTDYWNSYTTRYIAPQFVSDVVVADANNDGANDIIAATPFTAPFLHLLLWNKSISDWNPSSTLFLPSIAYNVEVKDLNNDGFNDIIAAGNATNIKHYYIRLWNSSTGDWNSASMHTFSSPSTWFIPDVEVGDANNDGLNDLILTDMHFDNLTIYCWNDTLGTWNPPRYEFTANDPVSVDIGDVNNDGQNDIVASCIGTGRVTVLLWNATTEDWVLAGNYWGGSQPRSVIIADVTGDSMNDVTFINPPSDTVSVLKFNRYPMIISKSTIQSNANWTQNEDFGSFSIDLTAFEVDAEDHHENLTWFPSGLDTSLVTVDGNYSVNDVLTFNSVNNQSGSDTFELILRDRYNFQDRVVITIVVNEINDNPVILSKEQLKNDIIWSTTMDSPSFWINLTPYESDVEDIGTSLDWFVNGLDPQIATVTGENSSNDILVFNIIGMGEDSFTLILIDSDGGIDTITITISVGPSIILILGIIIPCVIVAVLVSFYFLYWRRRKSLKKRAIKKKKG